MALPYSFGSATSADKLFMAQLQADLDQIQTDLTTLAADIAVLEAGLAPVIPQGRLTLTSGTAITTSDVSGATTLYYTPAVGRFVPIYDGTSFVNTDIGGELSQATTDSTKSPAAVAVSSVYDVFAWNDSGTKRATRGPAWTSDTARGTGAGTTELEQLNGIWVNKIAITNGPAAQRGTYLGTVRSNGSSQFTDSEAFRWVFNAYNAAPRTLKITDSTDTWTYSTASFRQANGSAANQVDVVIGLTGREVFLHVHNEAANDTATFRNVGIGVGADQTTANDCILKPLAGASSAFGMPMHGIYRGYPAIGRHFYAWLELGGGTDTQTWFGDAGVPTQFQAGLSGEVWM